MTAPFISSFFFFITKILPFHSNIKIDFDMYNTKLCAYVPLKIHRNCLEQAFININETIPFKLTGKF